MCLSAGVRREVRAHRGSGGGEHEEEEVVTDPWAAPAQPRGTWGAPHGDR